MRDMNKWYEEMEKKIETVERWHSKAIEEIKRDLIDEIRGHIERCPLHKEEADIAIELAERRLEVWMLGHLHDIIVALNRYFNGDREVS